MKFAVVGAGITGLGAAWLLDRKHDVSLFESDTRLGGHANTVMVAPPADTPSATSGGRCAIDTGFIVYNTASYPNLIALFDQIGVPTAETSMSFAVSLNGRRYEYSGSGLGGLFGQARNIASPAHWRMTAEIFRFFKQASTFEAKALPLDISLGDWLTRHGYSQRFIHAHIVPMGAAIWSTPADDMLAFPFASFARFFENHGLLQAFNRPPWRTVRGGSIEYVSRIAKLLKGEVSIGDPVVSVSPDGPRARITLRSGRSETFDGVLLACHGDEACAILKAGRHDAAGDTAGDAAVIDLMSNFRYSSNEAVLHRDASLMPRRRKLWSSWNYLSTSSPDGASARAASDGLSVSYWMNKLQPLTTKTDYFVTLNPHRPPADHLVERRFSYAHPMFDEAAMSAQAKVWPVQGRNAVWLAGSYLGFGFHEDGLQAGLAAAEDMSLRLAGEGGKVVRPWAWDQRQGRIAIGHTAQHGATDYRTADHGAADDLVADDEAAEDQRSDAGNGKRNAAKRRVSV